MDACARSGRYTSKAQIDEAAARLEKQAFDIYGKSRQYYEPEIAKRVQEIQFSAMSHVPAALPPQASSEFPQDPEFLDRSERYHTVCTLFAQFFAL